MFGSDESYKLVKPNSRRRVLKPPGGGSSDIFGASGGEPIEPQRKIRNHLTSSIFGGETVTPSRNKPDGNQTSAGDGSKGEAPAVNGTSNSSSVASTPAATPAAPAAPTAAPSAGKQRVPPGGFSSGLW